MPQASLVFTGRLSNSFTLSKQLNAQLAANYRPPVNTAQGTRGENCSTDLAARYNMPGEHGTLTLRVADIFNTLRFDSSDAGAGFATVTRFGRAACPGCTYRFGQKPESRKRHPADDESGADS